MKNNLIMKRLFVRLQFTISVLLLIVGTASCEYEEIAPMNYPEGKLYLPVAYSSIVYAIDDVTQPTLADPTPGSPFRYELNEEKTQFNIPLAVYRSGLNPGETVRVEIHEIPKIIEQLRADENFTEIADSALLQLLLLPAGAYSLVESVEMTAGQRWAPFKLSIDFEFLKNHPGQKYVLGIGILSYDQECNPDLSRMMVLIDTQILLPAPAFSFTVDDSDNRKVSFNNESRFALADSYRWDFGDGSEKSGDLHPVHFFPEGTETKDYTVTLTAEGVITGEKQSFSQIVTIKN